MNVLTLIEKLYGGSAVLAEPALCLNSRSSKSGCTACVTACPVGAISLTDTAPELDPMACKGCGLCEPVCPTGVFALKETAGLLPKLGEGKTAWLTCSASQGGDRVKVPCLAGLSAETLAAAAAGRTLLLVAPEECASCTVGGHGRLEPLAGEAGRVLEAFGLEGTVRLVYGEQAANAELAAANQLDRRQFLSFARMGFMAAATAVVKPEKEAATLHDLPTQVPQGRRHFLTAVRKQAGSRPESAGRGTAGAQADGAGHAGAQAAGAGLAGAQALRFGSLAIAEGCDGCEACTSSCPSGALQFIRDAAEDRLTFVADRCVACPLCAEACPHKLLTLEAHFGPAAVASGEGRTLAALPKGLCTQCGKPFHGTGEKCSECRKIDWMTEELFGHR